ncbi:hypothetical protein [Peribacillus simplex]|uniref:hypothetical protein n=1 Tax=Peribacillus simplex TaxID=1478 RepID=UPI003D28E0BD
MKRNNPLFLLSVQVKNPYLLNLAAYKHTVDFSRAAIPNVIGKSAIGLFFFLPSESLLPLVSIA